MCGPSLWEPGFYQLVSFIEFPADLSVLDDLPASFQAYLDVQDDLPATFQAYFSVYNGTLSQSCHGSTLVFDISARLRHIPCIRFQLYNIE